MSDADLRELERRFRASGSVDDEAAWLRARVRTGVLEIRNLELAANCGHEAAQIAALREGLSPGQERLNYGTALAYSRAWAKPVEAHGHEARLRSILALAHAALAVFERCHADDRRPRGLLEQVEAAFLSPDTERTRAVVARCDALGGVVPGDEVGQGVSARRARAAQAAWREVIGTGYYVGGKTDGPQMVAIAIDCAKTAFGGGRKGLIQATKTVRAELVPWLLGYSDPVCERVEARKAARE